MHTYTYMYFYIYIYVHTEIRTRTLAQEKKQCRAAYNNSKQQLMLVILDLAARARLGAFHIEIRAWSKGRQLPAQCLTRSARRDATVPAPGGSHFLLPR